MKFYILPSYSPKKFYYSWYSSFLFIVLGIYFILKDLSSKWVQYNLLLVGFISIIHHRRSFEDEYHDIYRLVDIFFALLLSFRIVYENCTPDILFIGTCFIFFFLFTQIILSPKNPKMKSILHALLHLFACICILLLYNEPSIPFDDKSIKSIPRGEYPQSTPLDYV